MGYIKDENRDPQIDTEEILHRFGHHRAAIEGPNPSEEDHAHLRTEYVAFAEMLNQVLPDGREKEIVMTKLEEVSMWSHKSLARENPLDTLRRKLT